MLNFEKKNVFNRILIKTKQRLLSVLAREDFDFEDLEEYLILSDLPVEFAEEVIDYAQSNFSRATEAIDFIKKRLVEELSKFGKFNLPESKTSVLILTGVNGSGKTTTAAKLGNYFAKQGKKVLLAAADTFRAAGSEQLEIWAKRLNLPVVSQQRGADPAAVVFDAVKSALAKNFDMVIADSAGRLHTRTNLMSELEKIVNAAKKSSQGNAEVISFLVLDANFGANALRQVEMFSKAANIEYLIGTKLDSSARAGSLLASSIILQKPIAFVGTGERPEDIEEFDVETFVDAFFEGAGKS